MTKKMTAAEKKTQTHATTVKFTRAECESWPLPVGQRPQVINAKVRRMAAEIAASGGVIPGVITLGVVAGDPKRYLIDGQHRRAAFLMNEDLQEGYATICERFFTRYEHLDVEFCNLQKALVRMRPNDTLRASVSTNAALRYLTTQCKFLGFNGTPITMAPFLRAWAGSATETPTPLAVDRMIERLTTEEARAAARFATLMHEAWGDDGEQLYNGLNLIVCAWLYRRLVLEEPTSPRAHLSDKEFGTCLYAIGANERYVRWLKGRTAGEISRGPAFNRVKAIMAHSIQEQRKLTAPPALPAPAWVPNRGTMRRSRKLVGIE